MKIFDKRELKLFLTFFIIYIFFIQWYGWNEQSRFILTKSIVEESRFEIDSFYNSTGDRSYYNGHYYSDKEPGLSFLASPIYETWKLIYNNFFPQSFKEKYAGDNKFITEFQQDVPLITYTDMGFFTFTSMILLTAFTSSLFSSLTAILVYKISKFFTENEKHRLMITFAYAFGTLAFIYALHFMSHASGTFFLFLSFYLLFTLKNKFSKKLVILAGLSLGFSLVTEISILVIAPFLIIYALIVLRKNFPIFLLTFLLGVSPLLFYNYSIFNNPFDLSSSYIDRNIYGEAYQQIFFTSSVPESKYYQMGFSLDALFKHFHLLSYKPNVFVMMRLLFYPYRGLFIYSPILLLSIIGLILMFKSYRTEAILIILILISLTAFLSMRRTWWGGYSFGSRYLLPVIPFLSIPVVYSFKKINRYILIIIIAISIFITFLGLQPAEDMAYDWNRMDVNQQLLDKQNSFEIIYNPLLTQYLPYFLKYGPRSGIFENLVNGYISIDVRSPALSKSQSFPFDRFYVPFLSLVPVLVIILILWGKDIYEIKKIKI